MSVCRRCFKVKKDDNRPCLFLLDAALVMCQYSREPPQPFFCCTIGDCKSAVVSTRLFCERHTTEALLETVLLEPNQVPLKAFPIDSMKPRFAAQVIQLHNGCTYQCSRGALLAACFASLVVQATKGVLLDPQCVWNIMCPHCSMNVDVTAHVDVMEKKI